MTAKIFFLGGTKHEEGWRIMFHHKLITNQVLYLFSSYQVINLVINL